MEGLTNVKIVNAGACEGKVNILDGSVASNFEGGWTGFLGLGEKLSVLFKKAILWVLAPSSLVEDVKGDFGVRVMCP